MAHNCSRARITSAPASPGLRQVLQSVAEGGSIRGMGQHLFEEFHAACMGQSRKRFGDLLVSDVHQTIKLV